MKMRLKLQDFYCPFPSAVNQHCEAAWQHTLKWLHLFNFVTDESVYKTLEGAKYYKLAARICPNISLEALKIFSDSMLLFFILDEQSEDAGTNGQPEILEPQHERLVDILTQAELSKFQTPTELAMRDLGRRLLQLHDTPLPLMLRFAKSVKEYFEGLRWEALNHSHGITPDVETYIKMRPFTNGAYLCFDLLQIMDQIALPPEVIEYPMVKRLELAANNAISRANDVLSLEKDINKGHTHNLVLVLQHSHQLSRQEAVAHVTELHDAEVQIFIELSAQLPSFGGEIDANLQRYLSSLRACVRGLLDWHQDSDRYQ